MQINGHLNPMCIFLHSVFIKVLWSSKKEALYNPPECNRTEVSCFFLFRLDCLLLAQGNLNWIATLTCDYSHGGCTTVNWNVLLWDHLTLLLQINNLQQLWPVFYMFTVTKKFILFRAVALKLHIKYNLFFFLVLDQIESECPKMSK